MREKLKNELLLLLNTHVDDNNLKSVSQELDVILSNYEVETRKTDIVLYNFEIPETVKIYIVTKKISGLSEKSLYLYSIVLKDFFITIQKTPDKISANDIRLYLYTYQKEHNISNRTLDCRRTIICSYFGWMASEEYINKNPAINITPIKYERKHKKPMSQLDLEKVRSACETNREKAIVEMLYSTGCRVSELEHLNISDVNFETKEVMLFGKGNKHRVSYLNAKAEISLRNYLKERTDNDEALFVYNKKPYSRLKKSGIELIIKNIVNRTNGVDVDVSRNVKKHTTATHSLNHGMNVVEVSKLLGHESIETTMQYISTSSESIKNNYQKYVI